MTQLSAPGRPLRPRGKLLQEDARRHHRALLLQSLFRDGPASRADLARATGLTRVTVSDLVGGLVEEGLVEELGARPGGRVGKPATLVGFAPDAADVVCLDLSADGRVCGALVAPTGRVRLRRSAAVKGRRGDDAVALVLRLARDLVALAERPVLGVGVGSPGVVDPGGTVLDAPNLGWHGTPLSRALHERLGLPVHVANDANTAALGEHTFGRADSGHLMVLRVGTGVGAGLVLGGALLHGHGSAAGEVGHVVVDEDGEECACGRTGCLETLLAVPRLRARVDGLDPAARADALAGTGRRLGAALAPVVGALNLRHLVLSGPPDLLDGPLAGATADALRRRLMPVVGDDLVLRTSDLGEDVVLVGAAVLVLNAELGVS
ncbi:ROK family protein [Vallicoccus soli]|uniref:ROK family protein n=1 Tax=Vallicoccus soli TaxID=2339232 RepID=A0A3A3YX02_9ACTN|nr:ROK family protein [Vallicoccus soli]RJK94798.1 ROK family protein [Vallicoccus soli]